MTSADTTIGNNDLSFRRVTGNKSRAAPVSIVKKLTFCSAVGLCIFGFTNGSRAGTSEPYTDIWSCLYTKIGWSVPNGQWKYNVQASKTGDAFYIGTNQQHFTILKSAPGYHYTIGGRDGGQKAASHIPDLLFACNNKANPSCSKEIIAALEYMHDKCP